MHCVNEYEKTIEQLLDEKTKQRSVLTSQAEARRAELGQVRIEVEDVKRASRDLTKKYSRTREAITGYMSAEAELKGEVETLVSRVKKGRERFEMLKADAEAQLEGANNRLGEVRCYASCTAQSFSYTPWILAAFLIAATVLCNCGIGCD